MKEMRIAGIDTLNAANRYLEAHWVPFWNARFTVEPAERHDAHRLLPRDADLDGLFAETADRVIARDFTTRFANRRWQIPEQEAQGLRPGTKVVVEQRLNGELRFRTGDRYLAVLSLPRPARRRHAPSSTRQRPVDGHLNERPHRLPQYRHARVVRKRQPEPASRRAVEREVVAADVDDAEQTIPALHGHAVVAKRPLITEICLADCKRWPARCRDLLVGASTGRRRS